MLFKYCLAILGTRSPSHSRRAGLYTENTFTSCRINPSLTGRVPVAVTLQLIDNICFTANIKLIGQLHYDVILLQLPESLSLLFSCAN